MMCGNCGAVFDEKDVCHYREDYGEVFAACPECGASDFIETKDCLICGKEMNPEDMCGDYCPQCLWEAIDYDTALDYMKSIPDGLSDFVLRDLYGAGELSHSSESFDAMCEIIFRNQTEIEETAVLTFGVNYRDFLDKCRQFCMPHYPSKVGGDDCEFADWFKSYQKERAAS